MPGQAEARGGAGDRADLRDHVRAPGVVLYHLLQPADLAFDLAQPGQVVGVPGGVPSAVRCGVPGRAHGGALTSQRSRSHNARPELTLAPGLSDLIMSRSRRYSSASI